MGSTYAYTVASVNRGKTAVYAAGKNGHTTWKRVIGPAFIAREWPHAVSAVTVYVQSMRPKNGIVALNAGTGAIRWSRQLANVQSLTLANGVLYALSFSLGDQIRLLGFKASTGSPLGAITLSSGYYAFSSPGNGLMVANGMVFIRAIGPKGAQEDSREPQPGNRATPWEYDTHDERRRETTKSAASPLPSTGCL